MNDVLGILNFILESVWHVWPAFLISVAIGILIRTLKLDTVIRSALNAQIGWAIVLATAVGAFSPFCSCSVVPVISGLLISGVPLAPVMSFWLASPTMDPEIFTLSVATLGWPLAVARLASTLVVSLGAGYVTWLFTSSGLLGTSIMKNEKNEKKPAAASCACQAAPAPAMAAAAAGASGPQMAAALPMTMIGAGAEAAAILPAAIAPWSMVLANIQGMDWRKTGREMVEQTLSLGRWLLLAFFLEALITRYVPQDAIAGIVGQGSVFAVPLASLIGIPLYLSNITALPIVAGLLSQGMQPGAAIAFLIAGPITTIPAMAAVWGIVKWRVFLLYLGLGLFGSIIMGYVVNLVLM
jgi:uncharacterized membrane protein YraQ (UPF0718 family)